MSTHASSTPQQLPFGNSSTSALVTPDVAHLDAITQSHERCAALGLRRVERPDHTPLIRADLATARERNLRLHAHAAPATRVLVASDNPYATLRLDYHLLPLNAAPAAALQALEGDSPAAPLWLVAFSATAWRFDDAGGILHGPGIELAARSLYEDGDLRIYSIMGGPP